MLSNPNVPFDEPGLFDNHDGEPKDGSRQK